jgi:hypothetical protein
LIGLKGCCQVVLKNKILSFLEGYNLECSRVAASLDLEIWVQISQYTENTFFSVCGTFEIKAAGY